MSIRPSKKQQWIAGYCPFCRDINAFRVVFARSTPAPHLMEECEACGIRYQLEADTFLNVCESKPQLTELIQRTRPHLPAWVLERIAFDRKVISQQVDLVKRAVELRSCFSAVEYLVRPDAPGIRLRHLLLILTGLVGGPMFSMLVVVTVSLVCRALTGRDFNANPDVMVALILIPWAAFGGLVWLVDARRRRRRIRGQLTQMLARVLRPLRPTDTELADVDAWLRASGSPLARCVRLPEITAAMRKLSDVSLQNVDELGIESWGRRIVAEHNARRTKPSDESLGEPDAL